MGPAERRCDVGPGAFYISYFLTVLESKPGVVEEYYCDATSFIW
jgi:hypothetical protein